MIIYFKDIDRKTWFADHHYGKVAEILGCSFGMADKFHSLLISDFKHIDHGKLTKEFVDKYFILYDDYIEL